MGHVFHETVGETDAPIHRRLSEEFPIPNGERGAHLPVSLLLVLALLVGNATAGLASRLAGSLALPTAAMLRAGTQIPGLDGLDSFHNTVLQSG